MIIIPAIDLKNGKCVRLRQGLMHDATIFADDPVEMAGKWVAAGCQRLHLVDLDGAVAGKPVNADIINRICESYPQVPVQVGGGIRHEDTVAAYIDAGVTFVIIGTQAIKAPHFVTDMCDAFPERVIVGLDAKDGLLAVAGWTEVSGNQAATVAKTFEDAGVSAIIYTDIARDGMMQGVNVDATRKLAAAITIPVIASGGVTHYQDVRAVRQLSDSGVIGAIIGRALYEGTIELDKAQKIADGAD